jgi:hypothetical protein
MKATHPLARRGAARVLAVLAVLALLLASPGGALPAQAQDAPAPAATATAGESAAAQADSPLATPAQSPLSSPQSLTTTVPLTADLSIPEIVVGTEPVPPTPAGVLDPRAAWAVPADGQLMTVVEQSLTPSGVRVRLRYSTVKDAYIASGTPDTNYGGFNALYLGWNNTGLNAMRILLQFDLGSIPGDADIQEATFNIFQFAVIPPGDGNMDFRAQYMQSDWNEFGVTWNNANFLGGDALPLGTVSGGTGWRSGNAIRAVRDWVSGSQPNRGVLVTGDETPDANRMRQFHSREQPGFVPYLEVQYEATCDNFAPTATVEALPQFRPGSFTVRWSGFDSAPPNCTPTGIASFDVQFRINGGSWHNWQRGTTSTSATFDSAANGQFVEFRARAVDRAGNLQGWTNTQASTTIDTVPPSATMQALPQYTTSEVFTVNWSGTDNLSGIARYDVQFRVNNGDWQTLVANTTATSFQVTGAQQGQFYQFRARAVDNVGNVQPWPGAQTETTIVLYPFSLIRPFNPPILKPTATVTDTFTVSWVGLAAPGQPIVHFDVFYRYNGGAWTNWQRFPASQSSASFPFASLGLGDGLYEFEVVATNSVGRVEPRNMVSEQSMIVDLADAIQPIIWMPYLPHQRTE